MTPPIFDSHAHLDDPDWPVATTLAQLTALPHWRGTLTAGYGPERFETSRLACQREPRVRRSLGLHPWWLAERDSLAREQGWQLLRAELNEHDAAAVGEIGVDKNRQHQQGGDDQQAWLERGLQLAKELELPVVLHIVGWHGRALAALRKVGGPWRGAVHRYSGSPALVREYIDLGLHIGLALEPRENADKRAAVARVIPGERLLVESDWPFGELDYLQALEATWVLAQRIAAWRGEDATDLAARHNHETQQLFWN